MIIMSIEESPIVQAFSSINFPEQIIRDIDIQGVITGMTRDQQAVKTTTQRLERLRREEKDGNSTGNRRNDRSDNAGEAQLDLNKSIGNLTQRSSQLLIFNTAISKVLGDQQGILLSQQNLLKQQTDDLAVQSEKILSQQIQMETQQEAISKANRGLLEAKGVTHGQAIQLIGCVERVSKAEAKIGKANHQLHELVEKRLSQNIEQCTDRVNVSFRSQDQRNATFEQQVVSTLAQQSKQFQGDLKRLAQASQEFESEIKERLQSQVAATLENFKIQRAAVTQQGLDIDASVKKLRELLETSMTDCQQKLMSVLVEFEQRQVATSRQQALHVNSQLESTQTSLTQLTLELDKTVQVIRSHDDSLQRLRDEQARNFMRQRVGWAVMGGAFIAWLAWQVALYFA